MDDFDAVLPELSTGDIVFARDEEADTDLIPEAGWMQIGVVVRCTDLGVGPTPAEPLLLTNMGDITDLKDAVTRLINDSIGIAKVHTDAKPEVVEDIKALVVEGPVVARGSLADALRTTVLGRTDSADPSMVVGEWVRRFPRASVARYDRIMPMSRTCAYGDGNERPCPIHG